MVVSEGDVLKRTLAKWFGAAAIVAAMVSAPIEAQATPFTTTVPNEGISLPGPYPEAGGVAIVLIGANGQVYYQFSDPAGAFRGFQFRGSPSGFRGNPFTINNPIPLDCGVRTCSDYFGTRIDRMYVRFSAYDGDTQTNGFDEDDIDLIMNGVNVGNWSDIRTEKTDNSGTQSFGFEQGFGNNSFNTGWFFSDDPVLMDNILTTQQTTTQVFDSDPNDNYWDFRRGNSLPSESLRTIAPGYEFEKTADRTTFAAAGEVVTYSFLITNIGSVDINDIRVTDDRIVTPITCAATFLPKTTSSGTTSSTTCTGQYTITQDDFDSQTVTNIAQASGTPEFGSLGAVQDTVTITSSTALAPGIEVLKSADRAAFSTVGEVITYTYVINNTGNTTLTDVVLTDDKIPGNICTIASLVPQAPNDTTTCTATYTVTQDDIDDFALSGQQLVNVATVASQDPNGANVGDTDDERLDGPAAAPALTITKTAIQGNFDAVNDLLQFEIAIQNTGNVTWPAAPAITDPLITNAGGSVVCPAGTVAPNATIICTGDYRITQPDLNAEEVENIATADITVGGVPITGTADVTVPAVITTGLTIVKRLPAGADTTFDALGDTIDYEYVLTNTGTVDLFNPTITDDKVSVSCPVTTIGAGASITCTSDAPHVVDQDDLDAGFVTNIASASSTTQTGDTVDTDDTSLTVNADQMPALLLDKAADPVPAGSFQNGQVVNYTFTVTNTGNTTLTAPIFIDDDRIGAPFECAPGPIPPAPVTGSQIVCVNTYTLDNDDVAAGFVTNRATASSGATTSNEDTAIVFDLGAPDLDLTKTLTNPAQTFSSLTDTIDYTFTVRNSGTTTITSSQVISINDPKVTSVTCAQPATLIPGGTFTCTGSLDTISQADIDAGQIGNTATASFTDPFGNIVTSPSSTATIPSSVVPAMSLVKTGPADFGAVGSTVTYTFDLTNDSAQTIAMAEVTDVKIPALDCTFTNIAPFSTVSCTGDYEVTQADLDLGTIDNVANASGTAPTGEILSATASETVTADPATQIRALSLDKTANVSSFAAVGDEIRYNFSVTNTGTLTLNDIVVTDPQVGLTCTIPRLAPMITDDTTCIAAHTVTQDDIDAGSFDNVAEANAPGAPTSQSSVSTPGPTRTATFTVEKTANDTTDVQEGQVITYSHVVTNTGNTTLDNITLTDTHTSASGTATLTFAPSNVITTLGPNETATVTTRYTVTQDDIDAGNDLTNTVSATATPQAGLTPPTATDDEIVDVEDAVPAISVVKSENDNSGTFGSLPSSELYTFSVTNDGNVTLTGFTLTDDLTGFTCPLPSIPVGGTVNFCADGTTALQDTYDITQADIDRAQLTNTVTVTDGTLTATDDVTLTGPAQVAAITMVKTATSGANFSDLGDEVTYDYVVTNAGNITLRGPITVTDDKTTVTCPITPAAGIPPSGTLTCTATYAVTQQDLNAGFVTNEAEAFVTQTIVPGGPTTVGSGLETETVTATQTPSLDIEKVITPGTPTTFAALTDSLSYDFTITNNGNVTIEAPITVNDDQIGNGLTCATVDLDPGESAQCTHIWTATQPAIDASQITNTASPVATFGGNPVPSDSDSVIAVAIQSPELSIIKTFDLANSGSFAAGQTFTYDFRVTNEGNTTITTQPVVNDSIIDPASLMLLGTFPAGGLLPGQFLDYTGTYAVTLTDVQLGSITNTATASADGITSPPASVVTPDTADPALSIVKEADVTSFSTLGEIITYTYTVTNTSDGAPAPAFANAITVEDDRISGTISCPAGPGGQLLVGQSVECTATYAVTQADLDAGTVVNSAVAETVFGGQDVLSPAAIEEVTGVQEPELSLLKEVIAGNDPAAEGDMITYRMTAENEGNQTLSNVQITDPRIPDLTCTVGGIAAPTIVNLAPGGILICEGSYTVQQSDIDVQDLSNTATTTATNPSGTPVSATDTATQQVEAFDPSLLVVKSLTSGEPGSDYSAEGEEMTFRISVTNNGNITLDDVSVTDSIVAGQCDIGTLAPGDTDTNCEFVYSVTQTDIDNGFIDNIATAEGQPRTPDADEITQTGTLRSIGPAREPGFSLVKEADLDDFAADNVTITYTYTVANTGNVTLFETPVIDDDKIGTVTCPPLTAMGIPPLGFITCTATYDTTQADVDNGGVTNIANVSSTEVPFDPNNPNGAEASETVPSVRTPGVSIEKVANATANVAEGDTITYTYTIRNTGNVTLTDIMLDDQHTSASGTAALSIQPSATVSTLAPNGTATLTADYVVTQADIDAGAALTNTVSLTSTSPDGTSPTATDDASVTPEAEAPAIQANKTVSANTGLEAGDIVTFDITVENIGNVTLDQITLTDRLSRIDGSRITPNPTPSLVSGDGADLSPGEVWTYQIVHTLTQDDVDAGGLSNSATATGTSPFDTDVSDVSNNGAGAGNTSTPFVIPANPSIEATKTVLVENTGVDETVTFEIVLRNTGNVTLTGVAVSDDTLTRADGTELTLTSGPSFAGASSGSPEGTLQVDETARYLATYVLTQPDVDAGGVSNVATGSGTPPTGLPVTDDVDTPATVTIPAEPSITMNKILSAGGPTFDAVDDVLTYQFIVTNTGNITLTDPITISDPLITDAGGTIVCPAPPLAPGAVATCEGSYSIIQTDIDTGQVDNTATASVPGADPVTDSTSTPALQLPALEVVKEAEVIASADFIVGAEVDYTYTVTNTGNLTLTDPITVEDNLIDTVVCPALPAGGLAPQGALVCMATYTVTSTDVQLSSVTNLASASSGAVESPLTSETIPADGVPSLTVEKVIRTVTDASDTPLADGTFSAIGDKLTYEYIITNSGTVSFASDITITDDYFDDPIACYVPDATNPDLIPTETVSCFATYTITQEDLDAETVLNTAFAQTIFGNDPATPVSSAPVTEEVLADTAPALETVKTVNPTRYDAIGDVLTYTITTTNTGNQTLTNIVVTDSLIPDLVCEVATLAPGQDFTCSPTLTITQAEMDSGELVNLAGAQGLTPDGENVTGSLGDATAVGPDTTPGISLVKTANPSPFGPVGSAVTYAFAVTNDGPFTLRNLEVTDPLIPGFSCTIAQLAVGATDNVSCSASYTVTQQNVDDGTIENTATVTGETLFDRPTSATDTITTDGPDAAPSLEVVKTAQVPSTTLGETITYTLRVTNTGNVTLDEPVITDRMTRIGTGRPTFLTTPFELVSGDLDGDDRIDVDEVWIYRATYEILQSDINAGGVSNTVTAVTAGPDGTPAQDVSDEGDASNGDDNPTLVPITADPVLDVTKTVQVAAAAVGEIVTFRIEAANRGNVDILNVEVTDTLTRNDGTDLSDQVSAPVRVAPNASETILAPGEVFAWTVDYEITQDDVDAGGISNVANVFGVGPLGDFVSDSSDNGDDGDGNVVNDPTAIVIAPAPQLDVVKTVTSADPTGAGSVVTFDIVASNLGNVSLSGLTLTDTLTRGDGTPLTPDSISPAAVSGQTIAGGASLTWTVTYTLTQDDVDNGSISNTASVTGTTPTGLPVTDVSDNGDDTDGNVINDATGVVIPQDPALIVNKVASVPERIVDTTIETVFTITVENAGNVTHRDLSVLDDMTAFVAPATLLSVSTPVVTGLAEGGANSGYNGTTVTQTLASGSTLNVGDTATIAITVRYDIAAGSPAGQNTAVVSSDFTAADLTASTGVAASDADPDILADKAITSAGPYQAGSVIDYEITFTNRNSTPEADLTLVDLLPAGLTYVPDSATFNGASTPAPDRTGRRLEWNGVTIGGGDTVTITLSALLLDGVGTYTNEVFVLDNQGDQISNAATATFTVSPEAVFDCTDVIGKVFDDVNGNGYQDPPPDARAPISDQTFNDGKFAVTPEVIDQQERGEPGLAGVHLVTVRGDIITTDAYGRFSVPCAELPGPTGANFTLKLDDRSLPTGYRVTSENPRTLRLTAGIMAEMNFGATLANLVDIDLLAAAFVAGSDQPVAGLEQGVDGLISQIESTPSVLRLTYYTNGESDQTARARLAAVEALINDRWRGPYRLRIETTIARVQ
ncbi:beta strand repeat-containing protein [Pseudooctadecabacter jejudonensis]|uniref:DUF11 domain-containing protein n=1 Tax=Pseudooctadecabacter jejudonensis TaxID=1391910 RepID=A0A1Y5S1Q5_9RHOB|nr:DUF11 domain-containing protein [Pseudooctadecabacter jejudonensis]SLN30627.1 hypothetical protein PSJ8397_01395 [Pseudooctadecabacter jejudonensis]